MQPTTEKTDFPDADEATRRLEERYGKNRVLPISMSIPEELIADAVPEKIQDFGNRVNTGSGYQFSLDQESAYFKNYRKSFLGFTSRKGGWDCLRHLEILASGCVPFMPDIDTCPPLTMTHYPRHLMSKAKSLYQHSVNPMPDGSLAAARKPVVKDLPEYHAIASQLLSHTRNHLTTKALARWVLDSTGCSEVKSILFLNDPQKIGYVPVMLFHGLREIMGTGVIDYPHMWYMYTDAPLQKRNNLYGRGFTYSGRLPDLKVNRQSISARIRNHEFDLIIFGIFANYNSLLPIASRYYDREEIFLIDCGDLMAPPGTPEYGRVKGSLFRKIQVPDRKMIEKGILFKREIDDSSLAALDTILNK